MASNSAGVGTGLGSTGLGSEATGARALLAAVSTRWSFPVLLENELKPRYELNPISSKAVFLKAI
jgi:hypothetical protein